jgi:hypothetical protein
MRDGLNDTFDMNTSYTDFSLLYSPLPPKCTMRNEQFSIFNF